MAPNRIPRRPHRTPPPRHHGPHRAARPPYLLRIIAQMKRRRLQPGINHVARRLLGFLPSKLSGLSLGNSLALP